jgi:DNA-binding CsgD family transcriptional regulator
MILKNKLVHSSNRVAHYIENYVTRAGAENKEEILDLFDKIHKLFPNWVICTCPMMHPDLHYVSQNGADVFGYSREYLIRNSRMEKFLFHVHDADQEKLYECISVMYDHLESVSSEEHDEYRMILHYRFRKPNGQFIYLHDEKAALNLRGSGNLYYSLFRDVTAERIFTGVKAELFKQKEGLKKIKEYRPSGDIRSLSKREQELVTLMRQGLSTKEIAGHLNISPNTARNIKSKLFDKYKVSSSIELLNMTL